MRKKYYKKRTCVDCGKTKMVLHSSRGIRCPSCARKISSKGKKLLDITGGRFGKLVAMNRSYIKNNHAFWLCKCDCGNKHIVEISHLRSGDTRSCGCLYASQHGKSSTKAYKSWNCMVRRCTVKSSNRWHIYGGKGIKVCKRWKNSFSNFLNDMGERPEGTSLDRIDINGNYCKDNCRWATTLEQARNRGNLKIIEAFGKKQLSSQWAQETGIKRQTIEFRIKQGWSPEEALTLPVNYKKKGNK